MWKKLTDSGPEYRRLELLLRIGVAGCFIGHGAFGVIGKEAWLPYFAAVGIGDAWAWRLMPVVGSIDVLIGLLVLIAPRPAYLVYAAFWATWTALLRPLAGESAFETLERAGNYGVPIALLLLAGAGLSPSRAWLKGLKVPPMPPERRRAVMLALRATVVVLLLGHGGLALIGAPVLASHAALVGMADGGLAVVGGFEIALAAAVAVRPAASLLLVAVAWKVGTEALYPVAGAPFWEFVERAGSYVAPLALWTMVRAPAVAQATRERPAVGRVAATRLAIAGVLSVGLLAFEPLPRSLDAQHDDRSPRTLATLASIVSTTPPQEAPSLGRLRGGGLVLACRHAITGPTPRVDRVLMTDRSTQRLLSPEGEEQARRLGEILRRKAIPIGEVFTSPYFRTADSAELTFGRAEAHEALYGNGTDRARALRRLLSTVPDRGTNRALMTHQGVLYQTFTDVERGSIREGDCLVVEPDGDGFRLLARLGPDEWEALR
jgi:phosphohistidine phosphatase SixA